MQLFIRRLALLMLILLPLTAAWTFGNREDPLVYADTLIAEQKYDEAILYLTEFIKKYPDRFDQAQAKLRRIIEIRMAYNRQADALLEVLVREPTNNEKKLALIQDLENFEKNPSPALRSFVVQTKELALFTFNRAQYEDVMQRGRDLIDQLRFADAARAYAEGLVLYRPEFIDSGYDPAMVNQMLQRVSEVEAVVRDFGQAAAGLTSAFDQLSGQFTAYAADQPVPDMAVASSLAANYSRLRNQVSTNGRTLEAQFATLTANNPSITENSFLPFAYRLVLGRRSEDRLEGITGAMDAQWAYIMGKTQTAMEDRLTALYGQALAAFSAEEWSRAAELFAAGSQLAGSGTSLVALWSQLLPNELIFHSTNLGEAIFETKGKDYARLAHHAELMADWAELARLEQEAQEQDVAGQRLAAVEPATPAEQIAAYLSSRQRISQLRIAMRELQQSSARRADLLASLTVAGFGEPVSADRQGAYDGMLASGLARAENSIIRIAASEAGTAWEQLNQRYEAQTARLATADAYLSGVPSDDPLLPDLLFRFPTLAIETATSAANELRQLTADVNAFLARYRAEESFVAASAAMSIWLQQAVQLATRTGEAINRGTATTAQAQEQRRLAESSRLEADRRVQESRAALNAANFELARERLDRARERYSASLGFEQNVALRQSSDQILGELAVAILRAENDRVVADTRVLLTNGRSLYLQGQFEQSQQVLLQARARWATTNVTPEGEVEYWLRLVQNALAVKSGRDIPVTAPLYPEMSQLLSNARQLYDEGARLLAARSTTAALRVFAQARENLDKVRLIFPLNQDASILALRIDRLTDIDAFNRKAASMVADARSKIRSRTDLAAAYGDLKDIQALEPRYPGLQALIEEAEILLGFRLPPPDPAALAESRSLLQAAQRIWDSRDTSRFPVAVTQLDRAIALNPNNLEASQLKDRINIFTGGQATLVLPSAAENLYAEAVRLFSQGEYLAARGRLARLYDSFSQARQVQKVIALDTRLSAIGY